MKILNKIIIFSILIGVNFSCEEFLTEVPQSQVDASTFYTNAQSAEIGITGAYNSFFDQDSYSRMVMLVQASTDDVNQPSGAFSTYQNRDLMTAPDGDAPIWENMYVTLANVNFFIQEVEKLSENVFPESGRKESILGEAHFLKGIVYYYLYNTWGSVPLIKEFSEDPMELIIPNSPKEDVRAYAIEQLLLAEQMLPDVIGSYPNDSETNLRKGRASKWAAKAYLARLAMEDQDWQTAIDLANEIINSNQFQVASVWRNIFQEPFNSSETIFEQQNDYSPGFFGSGIYGWFMGFDFEWSEQATNLFELPDTIGQTQGKDVRFELSHTPYPWGPNRWQPNKIIPPRLFANGGIEQANITLVRLTEMYFIKAEALNELGFSANKDEIMDILNMVRARAEDPTWVNDWFSGVPQGTTGIPQLDPNDYTSQEELRSIIREEKRREHMFEDIIRWVDLMRWDKEYLKTVTHAASDDQLYWPIPPDEIIRNSDLVQNPGWD